MASELDEVIAPEILGDEFHALIERLARTESVTHVLEIGSSAGGGSTSAFVAGLERNPNKPGLYCMELSKPRFEALSKIYADKPFVHCFNVSSVPIEEFPSEAEVARFHGAVKTALNKYPLPQVLGWLKQDIDYVQSSGVPQNGIELIKSEIGVSHFDMVLIDGSEFTGSAELNHVIGAKLILLDDTNAYKCHEARQRLLADPNYALIADNQKLRNGCSVFRRKDAPGGARKRDELPIHFFTIVLNGEPFIRYHLDMMAKLPFRWHWHIVEGVASLVHDTAWSVAGGGRIDASLHARGRSNDGTSAYLDEIAAAYPDKITLYRKPLDQFWDGKKEMVAAPLTNIKERCLLWQIDADELWTTRQVASMREAFAAEPDRSAAFFWCDYFVGPGALISTRYNYAQNPQQEWLRAWRYAPGDHWAAHEPPTLVRRGKRGRLVDIARVAPFLHEDTEALGAVFQHFAYVTPEQLRFKEIYYGYAGAVERWRQLQGALATQGPLLLRDYFPWVHDDTLADTAARLDIAPIATEAAGVWRFEAADAPKNRTRTHASASRIVIDGVFFQHNQKSGIARVWRALLQEWRASGFADRIVVLDRAGTAPRLPGIRYRSIPAWDERRTGADAFTLQRACDEEGAALFVSSYYTSPISTPSLFLAHDMIPELHDGPLQEPIWREKHHAIAHAARFLAISESTKRDLLTLYPAISPEHVAVIHNAAGAEFAPASVKATDEFRAKHQLTRPYLLVVGERIGLNGYKNGEALFRALQRWRRRAAFDVICVGGGGHIEPELQTLVTGIVVRRLDLNDVELALAYAGAAALLYPSRYEGFGLPLLEAMACGCPVLAARTSSLPEVGGEAVIYFDPDDEATLLVALDRVTDESARASLVEAGFAQARRFSWKRTAADHARVLEKALSDIAAGAIAAPSPVWSNLRVEQRANQAAFDDALANGLKPRTGLTSVIAQSPLREPLFAARGMLLKALPVSAIPAARRCWRFIMGVRA